jgi:predicted HicB family RNase H-like nuclease
MMARKPTGRPPGRPRSQTPTLAPPLWLRLSPAERAEVVARAQAAGKSTSAWVRRVVRGALGLE